MAFKLTEVASDGTKKEVESKNDKKKKEKLKLIEEEFVKYDYFENKENNKEINNIQKIKTILGKNKH